ncbi:urea ABC transporter ATP-binding protein UrtD [Pandoraea captiosa]|uniref:Urea ABC transporter ATP-binding protein UrtD n=1 Tax=Pandoraea captiosa TaxID=2508302 RepID=A0A5E4ZPT0_9BURK|nr:urea ABC transporter ATP-binding protein UrtD [Pandoraea captiosa]
MSNTDFLLAIEDLSVSFDGFKAIDSLNLYLERGELRVVIGPNGAGKTTRASSMFISVTDRRTHHVGSR